MTEKLGIASIPIRAELDQLGKDLDKANSTVESKLLAGIKSTGAKLADIGAKAVAGGIGVGIAALGALGAAGWKAANDLDGVYDTIATKTGATGTELEGLKGDFDAVFKTIPADGQKLGEVMAELAARTGATGKTLQDLAAPISRVSELMETDGVGVTEKLTRVLGDWGVAVEDGAGTLDKFFVAQQTTGAGMEDLMAKVVQFGSPLRLMGFSLEESIAMFAKWEKEGVNAELVMGSLRIAAGYFARSGVDLQEGLGATIEKIAGMTDASAALALGMEVFGARAGPDMVAAIREGRFELGDMVEQLNASSGAIMTTAASTDDWGQKLDVLKQKAMLALNPLGEKMMELAGTALDKAGPALDKLSGFITEKVVPAIEPMAAGIGKVIEGFEALTKGDVTAFLGNLQEGLYKVGEVFGISKEQIAPFIEGLEKVVGFVQENLTPILAGLAAVVLTIVVPAFVTWAAATITALAPVVLPIAAIGAAVALLVKAWQNDWGGIQTTLTAFWENTGKPIFETVKKWLQTELPPAIAKLSEWFAKTWGEVSKALSDFWEETGKPTFETVKKWLQTELPEAIGKMTAWFSEKWGQITGAFTTAKETIVGAAGDVKKWFGETLPNAAEEMRNKITSKVETVTSAFKKRFTDTMDELNPTWREDWEKIKTAASEKLEEAKVALGAKLDETKTKVGTFLTDTKKEWTDKWEEIRSSLAEFGGKLITAAGEAMGPFLTFVGEQVDKLKQWFTNVDWKGIGQAIIDGVKGGITDAAGALGQAAANAAKAALDAAKRLLGIKSPSKVAAMEIGKPFVLGIVEGVHKTEPELTGAVSDLMEGMADTATSLVGMGGYQGQAGIGSVVDAIISDARTAGKRLMDWFKQWTDQTRANVEMGAEAGGLLAKLFAPVRAWIDALTALRDYEKAQNLGGAVSDLIADTRTAGKLLMDWFKLWTEDTFKNVEQGTKAAELVAKLFAPARQLVDGVTAIATYQKAQNIGLAVADLITDTRAAGKLLIQFFLLWTENTFENVATGARASSALAALFASARQWVDGVTAIATYQRAQNIGQAVSDLITDTRAAGKLLIQFFLLWTENTFENVATGTRASSALAALFASAKAWVDGVTAIATYQRAQNIAQAVSDLIEDSRAAGRKLVEYFQLWTETTFANVEQATRAGAAMAALFAPARGLVDGITALAAYQRQGNIVKKVQKLIADARAAGKLLVDYFKLWTEGTFTNVELATAAATAMTGLFAALQDIADGLTSVVELAEIQPEAIQTSATLLTAFGDVFLAATTYMAAKITEVGESIAPQIAESSALYAGYSSQAFAWFRQGSDALNALVAQAAPDQGRLDAFVAALQRAAAALRQAADLAAQINALLGAISSSLGIPRLTLPGASNYFTGWNLPSLPSLPNMGAGLDMSNHSSHSNVSTYNVNAYYSQIQSEGSVRDTIQALQMAAA